MSLRWRLTILTTTLIAIAAITLGAVAYVTSSRIQIAAADRALSAALSNPRERVLESRLPQRTTAEALVGLGRVDATTGQVTVIQQAGSALALDPFPPLTAADIAAAGAGPITVEGSPAQRVLVREVKPGRLTVVAAFPLTAVDEVQSRLARGILLSALSVIVAGALASWFMVRRFFRPVDDMVASAAAIAAGDTTQRIPEAEPGTELGTLSDALNTMIASLTTSLAQVEASEERLRRFVSDASHEIRTPLTVISGYAELMQRDRPGLDDVDARALARIESESRRLERLVTQLLLLERLDRSVGVATDSFDLAPVVAEHFADLGAPLTTRPVTVDVDPTVIVGDPDAWRQVLANLAQNISRHTPPDSPVAVTLRSSEGTAALTIDDAGPGIPADQRATVLARFARVDSSRSSETGGFGLGMSIVAAAVSAANGTLELLDSPLGGLRVRITIPTGRRDSTAGSLPAGL